MNLDRYVVFQNKEVGFFCVFDKVEQRNLTPEEIGNLETEYKSKLQRYMVNVSFYVHALTPELAYNKANKTCSELNNQFDGHASVDSMFEIPFASKESKEININKLKF